jgi:hypothetical protein
MGAVENVKIDFGIKHGDVDAVPEFHCIFSENSYQIFAKINHVAEKSVAGNYAVGNSMEGNSGAVKSATENGVSGKSAEGKTIAGKSTEKASIRVGSLPGSNAERINVGKSRGLINSNAGTMEKNMHALLNLLVLKIFAKNQVCMLFYLNAISNK